MRIAIVSTMYPPYVVGGAERSVQELARGLAEDGHDVRVYCLGPGGLGTSFERDGNVRVQRLSSPAFRPFETNGKNASSLAKARWHIMEFARFSAYRFLKREFRAFEPDVIHTNNIAGFGWLAWKAAGTTPLVHTARDYYLSCLTSTHWRNDAPCDVNFLPCRVSKAPFRVARRRPDLFVGVSDDILARHRLVGSIRPGEPSITIYNQPESSNSSVPKKSNDSGDFVFGALGRLGADKGTWKIIEAFKALPRQVSGRVVQLRLAGNGTPEDLAKIKRISLADSRIIFVGPADPSSFYANVDCALVPTQWPEPFGRTAAEALLSGAALLASNTGGLPEVLAMHGGRARLVSNHTEVSAWTSAMSEVIADPPPMEARDTRPNANATVHQQYLLAYTSVKTDVVS